MFSIIFIIPIHKYLFLRHKIYVFLLNIKYLFLIIVAPQIMPFDFGNEPVNDQEMVVVICTVSKGDLPLNIEWYFDGKPLKSNVNGVLLTNAKRTSQLTIESVSHHNQGNYTCAVKNQAGTTNHTSELYVNGT